MQKLKEGSNECEVVDEGKVEKEKEEEKCTPSDEEIKARIEEVDVKNICEKKIRMLYEDYIVLDETPNPIIHLDIDIQLQDFQQNNSLPPSNKAKKRREIYEVLDEIYTLLDTIKLKKIWKKNL